MHYRCRDKDYIVLKNLPDKNLAHLYVCLETCNIEKMIGWRNVATVMNKGKIKYGKKNESRKKKANRIQSLLPRLLSGARNAIEAFKQNLIAQLLKNMQYLKYDHHLRT